MMSAMTATSAQVRIVDRDGTVVGWLGDPPQDPGWNVVGDRGQAGTWPWRQAAGLFTEYQKAKAWRGLRPEMVPIEEESR